MKDSKPQIEDIEKLKRAEEMEEEISRNEFQNEVMKIKMELFALNGKQNFSSNNGN